MPKKYYRKIPKSWHFTHAMSEIGHTMEWPMWMVLGMLEWLWLLSETGSDRIARRDLVHQLHEIPGDWPCREGEIARCDYEGGQPEKHCEENALISHLEQLDVLTDYDEEDESWQINDWRR